MKFSGEGKGTAPLYFTHLEEAHTDSVQTIA